MPHVLWQLQGQQSIDQHGKLELTTKGSMTPQEYDGAVADLVAYLQWMGEPAQGQRTRLGMFVLAFLAVMTYFAWRLNASYWKDVK
jgi:ubiquinol-cytochrome c reductase cytochrome c1 subunit